MTAYSRGVHVTKHTSGGWQVKRAGSGRASSVHQTQSEAQKAGRQTAINTKSELFVHGRNGQIRERNSHGNDPRVSKG